MRQTRYYNMYNEGPGAQDYETFSKAYDKASLGMKWIGVLKITNDKAEFLTENDAIPTREDGTWLCRNDGGSSTFVRISKKDRWFTPHGASVGNASIVPLMKLPG